MAALAPDAGRSWRWPATRAWLILRAPLRLPLMRQRGDHLVVVGSGRLARLVVRAELTAGGSVVVWADPADPGWARAAAGAGAAVVPLDDPEASVARLGLDRARAVLLLTDDDDRDVDLATLVLQQAARTRPAGDPLAVIAGVAAEPARDRLRGIAATVPRTVASARAIALDDLAARELFIDHPLDRFRRHGRTERVVFLFGNSPALLRYARRLAAGGHFRDGDRPRLILMGAVADDAVVPSGAIIEPLPAAADSEGFAQLLARHGDPVLVAIDCEDAAQTLALARAAAEHYRVANRAGPPVLVRTSDADGDFGWPDNAMSRRFGSLEQFARPDMLLQEHHDALARSIHEFYLEGRLTDGERIGSRASLEEWDDLPAGFRDDNRLVADCYELKLRDLGARVIEAGGTPLQLAAGELEDMARAEHERWMAAKLSDGWSYGATRDDSRRLHPDIVPYEALHERTKDLDREQVRVMLRLLARAGRCPQRALLIVIEPGAHTVGAKAAMDQAIAAILAHYPDRVPILSGRLDDAATCTLLATRSERVRLIVPGNADLLIADMDAEQARTARELLLRADSVIGVDPPGDPLAVLRAGAELAIAVGAAETPLPAVRIDVQSGRVSAPWS